MDWKQSYSDTKIELQMMQLREFELRKRWEAAQKAMVKGELPSSVYCHIDFITGLELYDRAAEELNKVADECMRLEGIVQQMESYMNQFDSLEHVIECKLMQGYTYPQMSKELCYSEKYLRNYRSKMKNKGGKKVEQSTRISC